MKTFCVIAACWLGIVALAIGEPEIVPDVSPSQEVSGITIGVGPNRTILVEGDYRFFFVPDDGGAATETRVTVGAGDTPVPPVPPDPEDTRAIAKAAVAAIDSPTKGVDSANIADAFRTLLGQVESGTIKTSEALRGSAVLFASTLPGVSAPAWEGFAKTLNTTMETCASLPVCASVLEVFAEELEAV